MRITTLLGLILPFVSIAGASAATVTLAPGDSIQAVITKAAAGDVIVLQDGVYHEPLVITQSITLKAQNPGQVTITNRHPHKLKWEKDAGRTWFVKGIDWPVHWLLVDGVHAYDYRSKKNFDTRECGPFWSKGFQEKLRRYPAPPLYFARDTETQTLWLQMMDDRDPNECLVEVNSSKLDGQTLVQKDLGDYWNQQEIVVVSSNPPEHPITMWYSGTKENPSEGRVIDFPKICGIVINIKADNVALEGLRIHLAPTVGVEINNSHNVTLRDCFIDGAQYGINTGYECTRLTVEHCEFDGNRILSVGNHRSEFLGMWNHSIYTVPMRYNGTGLTFRHNYVYEGFDLFQPRGRHKDFPNVPDLRSDVAYNVWQECLDNVAEFDSVEARMNMRFHHNLVLASHDALAITTTEQGAPLTIDHNIWWPGGNRIMKLNGTKRTNRGVHFVHNTYFTGAEASAAEFEDSVFENNLVMSACKKADAWTRKNLGAFFPTAHNLLVGGDKYATGFEGLVGDPQLGKTPETIFVLQPGSPAINAGKADGRYYQDNVSDGKPDLGALEHGQTIGDWRKTFGRCGPSWITPANQAKTAPNRPTWPKEVDPRWGGLDQ